MRIKLLLGSILLPFIMACNSESSKKKLDTKGVNDSTQNLPVENRNAAGTKGALAFVIGESKYQYVHRLTYPAMDADSIEIALRDFGIDVIKVINGNRSTIIDSLRSWSSKLTEYKVALLYYSGHGAEVYGRNYLLPTDIPNSIKMDINKEGILLDTILNIMQNANTKMNLVILDACRDNPFPTKSLSGGGLVNQLIPMGTFIGFAASPGFVSYDLGNTNSVYTEAILKFIRYPNITIDQVFNNVNGYVRQFTQNKQIPYKNSSLDADFYFNLSKNSSDVKDVNMEDKSSYSAAIKNLFPEIKFDAGIEDVLTAEFGESYKNAFSYGEMPISGECKNNEIRYYWRKFSDTKLYSKMKGFFFNNNLDSFISDGSTVFYTFRDNKLFRLAVNVIFKDIKFHQQFLKALGITDEKYLGRFYDYKKEFFTIVSLDDRYNQTSIFYGNKDSYSYCDYDWFSKTDTLNITLMTK